MQSQHAGPSSFSFFDPTELCQCRRQCQMANTETRTALHGLAPGGCGLFIPASLEVDNRHREEGRRTPRVKRAKPQATLGPFSRAFGLAGKPKNDTAHYISGRCRGADGDRCIE